MGTETYYVSVTNSRSNYTGFNDVTIARPKFIYFQATGLRPNARHFVFFDKVNVTNYVNTSIGTINDFNNLSRNDPKRNPGEKYINETGFPTALGGPTASIFSDDEGKIDGVFYLQSNSTTNFPTGTRILSVLDISTYAPDAATSYCSGQFTIDGGIENYSVSYYTTQEARTRYVADPAPDPDPPSNNGSSTPVVNPAGAGASTDPDPVVSKKEPKYLITGDERYQNINGIGYLFKTDPTTGAVAIVHKSETLGEILGEEKIGYGTGRITSSGVNLGVGDALVNAGFGGLDGMSTTNILASASGGLGAVVPTGGDTAFKLDPAGGGWVDQFSGESLFTNVGKNGINSYFTNQASS